MSYSYQIISKGSRGDAKIWIILIVLIVFGGVYASTKFGPVYSNKWEMEDYMEGQIRRMAILSEEELFDIIDQYAQKNQIPISVFEDCKYSGEPGEEGIMTCEYDEKINFPRYVYVYHVRVVARVPRIPRTAQ